MRLHLLEVAALGPDLACCVSIGDKTFSTFQNNQAFIGGKCCHLTMCLHLMEPNYGHFEFCSPNLKNQFLVNLQILEGSLTRPDGLPPEDKKTQYGKDKDDQLQRNFGAMTFCQMSHF